MNRTENTNKIKIKKSHEEYWIILFYSNFDKYFWQTGYAFKIIVDDYHTHGAIMDGILPQMTRLVVS